MLWRKADKDAQEKKLAAREARFRAARLSPVKEDKSEVAAEADPEEKSEVASQVDREEDKSEGAAEVDREDKKSEVASEVDRGEDKSEVAAEEDREEEKSEVDWEEGQVDQPNIAFEVDLEEDESEEEIPKSFGDKKAAGRQKFFGKLGKTRLEQKAKREEMIKQEAEEDIEEVEKLRDFVVRETKCKLETKSGGLLDKGEEVKNMFLKVRVPVLRVKRLEEASGSHGSEIKRVRAGSGRSEAKKKSKRGSSSSQPEPEPEKAPWHKALARRRRLKHNPEAELREDIESAPWK